ncbi:DUF1800 domain-containing protein [Fibrella aquatilis]|uniref:DUF1800 domain-containing protein n=1 Tax=Fibrella aquatilis TaxID=2817059 RepID=A0A939GAS0_9BACT|nr:DUF1800 domain-containing protein [Fibrella aquatilis]MBO0933809.1 DUF1800 domain-containing protein [Fibrella aquatilis]
MPYLDPYTPTLTARTAAHLLRRATFGPTPPEIAAFTGRTAAQAVQTLLANVNLSPPQPVDLDDAQATVGQPFLQNATTPAGDYIAYVGLRNSDFGNYIKYWWLNLMIQPGPVNLLDKLTLFWQNHFVTTREITNDYRFVWSYLTLLRTNALGNFRDLVTKMTKEPAMLRYLNGDMNEVGTGKANENYARELQELFTVGTVDAAGNANYTEDDVRNAARVLTGWKYTNYTKEASTNFATTFTSTKHDSTAKTFSGKYNNTVIAGRTGATAGDLELTDLVTMLLNHPQTARFICRKLYRWYVNDTVTADIETNVIVPLAQFFVAGNYQIQPIVQKLLTSQIFYDEANIGAMIKSPTEFVVGTVRFFQLPIAPLTAPYAPFRKTMEYLYGKIRDLQLDLLDQPTVFGYDPYYQTGYSKLWSNTNTMAVRSDISDRLTNGQLIYLTTYLDIAPLTRAVALQPNFGDISVSNSVPPGTAPITCVQVLDSFLTNLLATDLVQVQKDFLIDTIMMQAIPRSTWEFEWNTYRRTVTYPGSYTTSAIANAKTAVNNRLKNLLKFLLRLAEYHVF